MSGKEALCSCSMEPCCPLSFLSLCTWGLVPSCRQVSLDSQSIYRNWLISLGLYCLHWERSKRALKPYMQERTGFQRQTGMSPIHPGLKAELCCTNIDATVTNVWMLGVLKVTQDTLILIFKLFTWNFNLAER